METWQHTLLQMYSGRQRCACDTESPTSSTAGTEHNMHAQSTTARGGKKGWCTPHSAIASNLLIVTTIGWTTHRYRNRAVRDLQLGSATLVSARLCCAPVRVSPQRWGRTCTAAAWQYCTVAPYSLTGVPIHFSRCTLEVVCQQHRNLSLLLAYAFVTIASLCNTTSLQPEKVTLSNSRTQHAVLSFYITNKLLKEHSHATPRSPSNSFNQFPCMLHMHGNR